MRFLCAYHVNLSKIGGFVNFNFPEVCVILVLYLVDFKVTIQV